MHDTLIKPLNLSGPQFCLVYFEDKIQELWIIPEVLVRIGILSILLTFPSVIASMAPASVSFRKVVPILTQCGVYLVEF